MCLKSDPKAHFSYTQGCLKSKLTKFQISDIRILDIYWMYLKKNHSAIKPPFHHSKMAPENWAWSRYPGPVLPWKHVMYNFNFEHYTFIAIQIKLDCCLVFFSVLKWFFYFLNFSDPKFVQHAKQCQGKPGPTEGQRVKARVVLTRSAPYFFATLCVQHPQKNTGQVKNQNKVIFFHSIQISSISVTSLGCNLALWLVLFVILANSPS